MEATYIIEDHRVQLAMAGALGTAVDEEAVTARLQRLIQRPTGLLPPVIRWISPFRRWVMLERPPHHAVIRYKGAKAAAAGTKEEKVFNIPLPWTVELMCIDADFYPESVAVFALRNGPITSFGDRIGLLPLPNFYVSGAVCLPPREMAVHPSTLADAVMLGHHLTWQGGFNLDTLGGLKLAGSQRKPAVLFDGLTDVKPSVVYTRWEGFAIEEVMGWDWADPRGFGTHAEPSHAPQPSLAHLMSAVNEDESQYFSINVVAYFLNQACNP